MTRRTRRPPADSLTASSVRGTSNTLSDKATVAFNNNNGTASTTYLANNAYVGPGSPTDAYRGYSSDPYAVALGDHVLEPPTWLSSLRSTNYRKVGGIYRIEYDENWNKRDAAQPAIGSREPVRNSPRN